MDIELSADTLEGVETLVEDLHRDIVASLCLVTQCPIQVSGLRKIVDWRLGLHRRAITFYRNIGGLKVSLPALKEGHIESAMALNKLVKDDRLKRAMQFFRRGISARYSDEQFENFYFLVEILATRSMKKTTAKCHKCKQDLKCGDCGNIIADSEKPGSAVRAILEQSLEGMDTAQRNQLVKAILNARNSLQHGGLPDSIERKTGFAIHQLADVLGKTTFNYIMHDMNKLAAFPQLQLLVPSTYANSSLNYKMSGFIESSTSDASEPNPSDYDGIRVSMIRSLQKKKPAPN